MSKQIDEGLLTLYSPKKLLGSGAYGHVWKVVERSTKKELALKKIFDAFQNSVDAQRTYRQITVLHELDHPNIIRLHTVHKAKNNRDLYLVFEFMQADLHSLIGESILEKDHVRFICYQVLKALKYMHSAQLIHRDLKPSNLLINEECHVKLCDFGLVRSLTCQEDKVMVLSEDVATRWYRSPEMLLSSQSYGMSTDVWSLGCIMAEILGGKPIFAGQSTLNQLQKIIEFTGIPSKENIDALGSEIAQNVINQISVRRLPIQHYFPKSVDNALLNLVLKMLEFNPRKRITIEEAIQCNIFADFYNKSEIITCNKVVLPQIDDNVRLSVAQYRQVIYKDIERYYPNTLIVQIVKQHKNLPRSQSLQSQNKSQSMTKPRQNSLPKPKTSSMSDNKNLTAKSESAKSNKSFSSLPNSGVSAMPRHSTNFVAQDPLKRVKSRKAVPKAKSKKLLSHQYKVDKH